LVTASENGCSGSLTWNVTNTAGSVALRLTVRITVSAGSTTPSPVWKWCNVPPSSSSVATPSDK
jgi:hypothetical protein